MKINKILPQGNGRRARNQQQPAAAPGEFADSGAEPRPVAEPARSPAAFGGPSAGGGPPPPGESLPAGPPAAARPSAGAEPPPSDGAASGLSGARWSRAPIGGEAWAPIVIDEPIFDFEPKPPKVAQGYRPDTLYDGWSSGDFTVRLASVRGYSHRYSGLPRQDEVATGFDPESGIVLFAVADGVSSAGQSHIGAAIACTILVEAQRWMLDNKQDINLPNAVQSAAGRMTEHAAYLLGQEEPEPGAAERLLASTLIAGYIEPAPQGALAVLVQIGDSSAWVLRDGHYYPLLEQKNDPDAQIISSAVSPLPRLPDQITPATYELPPDAVLLIGTDGFGDPLGDGDGHVGHLFAEHLRTPPPARGLAHLLDFSRDTFDDDRTLLGIWQQPRSLQVPT